MLGWPKGDAFVIGWLLQTKALIMIVFANILLDKQIITSATFTAGQPIWSSAESRQARMKKSRSSAAPAARRAMVKSAPRRSPSAKPPAFSRR